jgi:H+/Cl- antiporter ClcA
VTLPTTRELVRQFPVAAVVGAICGLTLIGLSALAEGLETLVWDDLSSALGVDPDRWWWIVALLTVTGLLVGLVVRYAPGHAGPDPATESLVAEPLSGIALPGLALALVLMLAGGVSLGPENPIMLFNGTLIALLGARLLPSVGAPAWVGLSMAGTLGAMFGTPVAAALALSELQSGDPRVPLWTRLFGPLVAAGTGSAVMLALSDLSMALDVPDYTGFHFGDLGLAALIAFVAAALGLAACYALPVVHAAFHRIGNPVLMLTLGGFVLGWLGVLGGPETLFKGLDEMKDISAHVSDYSHAELFAMAGIKVVALVIAAAASFRGGRIFPAVFIGVVLGWAIAGTFDVDPAIAVSAGVLGMTIAASRNGWLSLFMAAVVVPDADLLPILVLAALPAWVLMTGRPELRVNPPAEVESARQTA